MRPDQGTPHSALKGTAGKEQSSEDFKIPRVETCFLRRGATRIILSLVRWSGGDLDGIADICGRFHGEQDATLSGVS